MTRFVVVPQWQGSPSARAMQLVDGAEAIAGDLPRQRTMRVEVPASAGESLDTGIRRLSSLLRARDALGDALDRTDATGSPDAEDPSPADPRSAEPVIVVGGDCGVAVPAIAHAAARHDLLAVVWFDAHGDLHTPDSSPSGAFAGMALRAVVEPLPLSAADAGGRVSPDRVVLAGARELDPPERAALAETGIAHLGVDDLADAGALVALLAGSGATAVHIHVDLDVLDPAVISGVASPVPFGLSLDDLVGAIRAVRTVLPLAGASIAGFAPASPAAAVDDLGTILRVVGALA
ncbi:MULTISPECIES: arginase family protein [unclassified Microbacterium]|uniref:arginase family protein n=1 Tax=unclassified Microbacterium TaxID=2609290 RepID=UPI003017B4C2